MPYTKVKQSCARTHIMNGNGEYENQGSGVILNDNGSYYVLTANHCVYGEFNEYENVLPENICIEVQKDYNGNFRRLKVNEIVGFDKNEDWVLLAIEDPEIDCDFLSIYRAKQFLDEEYVHFCGYQKIKNDQYRPWYAKIITTTTKEFKIKLVGDTFQQNGEDGSIMAKGLSGSGVFIVKQNKLYLIGVLKSVITDIALNNDIVCCSILSLENILKDDFVDLGNIDFIEEYAKDLDKSKTEEDVETWTDANIPYFDNIIRKTRVLFPEQKAKEVTSVRILEYLAQSEKNVGLSKLNSEVMLMFTRSSNIFEKQVRETYTQNISDPAIAKLKLRELENDFANHIKDIFNDRGNYLIELGTYEIINL